jgi:hypothetical protein
VDPGEPDLNELIGISVIIEEEISGNEKLKTLIRECGD